MILDELLIEYFKPILKPRVLSVDSDKITSEDRIILTEIGLPNGILDFDFGGNIVLKSNLELIIGVALDGSPIMLHLSSREIIKNGDCFLAASLSNLVKQLYVYDHLWNVSIKNSELGNYREDRNHKKYAKLLESQLLEIDGDLLENDNRYFWGSLIEDIDFGIVG